MALDAATAASVAAAIGSGVLTWAVGRWMLGRAAQLLPVDAPGGRRLHEVPTPRGGGLAIPFVVSASVAIAAAWFAPDRRWAALLLVLGFALPNGLLGAIDDFKPLRSRLKFGVQVLLAIGFVALGFQIRTIDLAPAFVLELGPVAAPFTVLWLVWMTNTYNFMDGLDALAAVSGIGFLVTLSAVAHLGLTPAQPLLIVACLATAGALGGFLVHNRPPAKVFMGDGGALFIGALLAAVVVAVTSGGSRGAGGVPLIVALLPVWSFLWDATFTMIFRIVKREDWLRPHRRHLFQRLVVSGWSHARVRRLYFAICALGCGGSIAWLLGPPLVRVAVGAVTVAGSAGLAWYVGRTERRATV